MSKDPLIDLIDLEVKVDKGQTVDLTKRMPQLQKIAVGIGWDVSSSGSIQYDMDASVFMLQNNGKIINDKYFIFYNNLTSPDNAVTHMGDNRTGLGDGDDETIKVDLSKVNAAVTELLFVVTIHEAIERKQNFGQIQNAFIRIYNQEDEKELANYSLNEQFSHETSVEFGKLVRQGNSWVFTAIGQGYTHTLKDFVNKYYN